MKARFEDLLITYWARFRGRRFPSAIGAHGVATDKQEGDGATPSGAFRVVGGLYRADRMNIPKGGPISAVSPGDIWSDDPLDPAYNRLSRRGSRGYGHERMRRGDGLYDLVLFTDHNQPPVPGAGSAIFLHIWRAPRAPTAGCVAFRRQDLLWIWARWNARSRVIIQDWARSPKIAEPTRT